MPSSSFIVSRVEMQKAESRQVIHRTFAGSLPQFIAAFLYGRKISDSEAEKIDRIIDSYREDK